MQGGLSETNQNDKGATAPVSDGERDNNTLRAYREIRRRIFEEEMPAGAQYLEQELAEMLGMSRTPVREALIRLADERLVEVRPRHGARVLAISADDMSDIYEIIAELEAVAVQRVAARGASDAEMRSFEEACARMSTAAKANNLADWLAADREFHARLVAAAGNARLSDVVQGLMDQAHRARYQTLSLRPPPTASNAEHAALLDAIRCRDAAEAHKIQHAHRLRSRTLLVDLLRQLKPKS